MLHFRHGLGDCTTCTWSPHLNLLTLRSVAGADVVSGVQGSLQSLFGMSSYVAALAFSDLAAFPWLMVASCSVVVTGAALCDPSLLLRPCIYCTIHIEYAAGSLVDDHASNPALHSVCSGGDLHRVPAVRQCGGRAAAGGAAGLLGTGCSCRCGRWGSRRQGPAAATPGRQRHCQRMTVAQRRRGSIPCAAVIRCCLVHVHHCGVAEHEA